MGSIVSSLIFIFALYLILTEKVHRTIIAVASAVMMVGFGILFGFYNETLAIEAIDYHTLGLLIGMMVLVALLQTTGFFEYIAILAGRWSKGNPKRLLIMLGSVTTGLSLFLDNVTTVLLIAPVTILISEIMDLNPFPYLMSEALLSNTGGVGTLIGDPPNVLIGSAVPFSFWDFITHAFPIVVITWLFALVLLLFLFRFDLKEKPTTKEGLERLDPSLALHSPKEVRKILVILLVTVVLFFFSHIIKLSPAFIALAAAAAALVLIQPNEISDTLIRIDWSALIFFSALFIVVGGLESAGVLHQIAGILAQISGRFSPVFEGIVMIWFVAILSSVVDNVPITIALIPIIQDIGFSGIEVTPFWWALVFGAGFGGNGTIIGSTANIIVVSISEKTRNPITAKLWHKRGLPVMILSCFVSSVLYGILFPIFKR